jgi:hypothetical protein
VGTLLRILFRDQFGCCTFGGSRAQLKVSGVVLTNVSPRRDERLDDGDGAEVSSDAYSGHAGRELASVLHELCRDGDIQSRVTPEGGASHDRGGAFHLTAPFVDPVLPVVGAWHKYAAGLPGARLQEEAQTRLAARERRGFDDWHSRRRGIDGRWQLRRRRAAPVGGRARDGALLDLLLRRKDEL